MSHHDDSTLRSMRPYFMAGGSGRSDDDAQTLFRRLGEHLVSSINGISCSNSQRLVGIDSILGTLEALRRTLQSDE